MIRERGLMWIFAELSKSIRITLVLSFSSMRAIIILYFYKTKVSEEIILQQYPKAVVVYVVPNE